VTRRRAFVSCLNSVWKAIRNPEGAISEPGFIGPVPYLVLLRWLIAGAVPLRFVLHRSDYSDSQWFLVLALIGLVLALAVTATLVTTHPALRRSKRIQGLFIVSDVLLISLSYFLTGNPQSDFFLFYYLPIFAATEYLGGSATVIVSAVITGAFACVITIQPPTDPPSSPADLFVRVFVPRVVFFMSVVFTSSFLLRLERAQREKAFQHEVEIQTLLDFKTEVDQLFDVNKVLELTLDRAVKIVGAAGGHISVIDYETGQLRVRFHTPLDYFREKPSLGDSLARQVVQQAKAQRLNDVHSDPELAGVFASRIHSILCVPIVAHSSVLGTLSVAGITSNHFSDDTERFLQAFANVVAMSVESAWLQARLAEKQRLDTWKEFTARIAHTIGTRIAVIEGSVTQLRLCLLEEGGLEAELLEDVRTYLGVLANGIQKAKTVLQQFREFAAPLELKLEPIDLIQLLKDAVREIEHGLGFQIELRLPDERITVRGDSIGLSDVYSELIRNAQDAMQGTDKPPRVMITAGVEVPPAFQQAAVWVEFSDAGPGVPTEDKKRIFEPFFSTKGRGSGLGLAVVKNIIEQHGGTIEEIGVPGTGARFIIRLPIVEWNISS